MQPIELYKPKPLKLAEIKRLRFHYSTEYQRPEVWKVKQKQNLIDSVLHGYPIGAVVLKKMNEKEFEVIDGQQRIQAILEFMDRGCKWKTPRQSIFPNKSYEEIKKNDYYGPKFKDYTIWYTPVPAEVVSDEDVAEIFIRLQEGTPTNPAEKLNALRGEMRNLIFDLDLSNQIQNLFKKTLIKNYRYNYRLILAYICLLEIEFLNKEAFPDFPNLRFPNLRKMYINYKEELPPKLKSNVKKVFNFLSESFRNSAKFIENNGDFLQVYLLAAILKRKYCITNKIKINFKNFFKDFLIKTIDAEKQIKNLAEIEIGDDQMKIYASLRSKGQTKENLKKKFIMITNDFFKKFTKIEPLEIKDQKRDFDLCQKLYVYYKKHKEICQKHKKHISWENSSFHHKKFHSKGGLTTIENCQLLCRKCHTDLHREEKDTEEIQP